MPRLISRCTLPLTAVAFLGMITSCPPSVGAAERALDPVGKIVDDDDDAPPPFDPSGRWVMTLPAGWQRKVTITRASDDTYLLQGAPHLLLNGVYQLDLEQNRFALIEANDPTEIAYDWRILNANTLQLVRQDTPSGGSYVGATLARHFNWDTLVDNSSVERVGILPPRTRRGTEEAIE